MTAKDRLPPWHEHHRLPNGRDVLVRPVRPEDADPLRAGFALMEPAGLRGRLAHGGAELSAAAAEELARLNPKTDFMLVASDPEPPGEALIAALAHVHTDAAGRRGEFVVLVSPFVGGMGLGRYLLSRVAKWARSRKLESLQGELRADDAAMLEMARTLGFREQASDDPSLSRVSLSLTGN